MSVDIRPAEPGDRPAVLRLLRRALGAGDDPRYERFLAWKHDENPFGRSYEWVAVDGAGVVGYRAFLRWQFVVDGGPEPIDAVRAVDTATDPDHQGRGIFRTLTTHAIDSLAEAGTAFVFNTPNDQSRPGYLTMGWEEVGRVPVHVTPLRLRAIPRLVRARVAAERWSELVSSFEPAGDVLGDTTWTPPGQGIATNRTPAYLAWRYGLADLAYRAVRDDRGSVVFRLRRRGPLLEATVADVLGQPDLASFVRSVRTQTDADVVVTVGTRPTRSTIRTGGPTLTWRALAVTERPALDRWSLSGGDLELF